MDGQVPLEKYQAEYNPIGPSEKSWAFKMLLVLKGTEIVVLSCGVCWFPSLQEPSSSPGPLELKTPMLLMLLDLIIYLISLAMGFSTIKGDIQSVPL